MIFYATSGLHQSDILAEEARMAGGRDRHVKQRSSFHRGSACCLSLPCLRPHRKRLLLGIYEDDDIRSADEFMTRR